MFKTIKRIYNNIKWAIFNHPPIGLIDTGEYKPCKYCGRTAEAGGLSTWTFMGYFTICCECMEKVFDAALIKEK